MFEKILVCLDGSEIAEQILPYAAEESLHFHSQVVLLHVVTEPVIVTPGIPGAAGAPVETPGMLEQMQKEQKEASIYLEDVANHLQERGLSVEPVILQGVAGATIINYANENDIGLIAIATHGRSGLGRVVFGSVADYVLRNSGLPILVIRPQEAEG
jgi:nucleotide-binding universal stress UspA family protein